MKNDLLKIAVLAVAASTLASRTAPAKTTMTIVGQYGAAGKKELWDKTSSGKVPSELLQDITVANPSRASQAPYQDIVLQNDRFVVCYTECATPQPLKINQGQTPDDSVIEYDPNAGLFTSETNESSLKTTNVYYWVNRLMDEMAEVGFKPLKRLLVRVDRDVQNPANGAAFKNNAFFNDRDWTLSFLPVKSGGLFTKATLTSPSFDPSVGMHETMHSVFQQAIGPILNSEVMGLHEAFADYFALDTLNDSRLGLIFASGSPLRKNDVVLKYKAGMEAHELGNVVSSALWKIRGQIGNREVAKTLAFRTIQALGRSPYIAAGDVAQLHIAIARDSGIPRDIQANIEATWAETGLKSENVDAGRLVVPTNFSSAGYFSLTISTQTPDAVATQWGLPSQEMNRISFLGISPLNDNQTWYNATIEREGKPMFSVRALIAKDTGSVLSAFDGDGKLIEATNQDAFSALKTLSTNVSEMKKWKANGHQGFIDILQNKGFMGTLFKAKNIAREDTTLKINGAVIPAVRETCDVKPALWLSVVAGTLNGDLLASLSTLNGMAVYTVDAKQFPNLRSLEVSPGRRLVGFSARTATGIVSTSLLSGFDPNNQTLGATSPMQ